MARQLPLRLILAYVLDWVLIICVAAFAGGVSYITPYHRPFSLLDLSISYPYVEKDLISTGLLVILSLVIPGIVIVLVTAIFIPAPSARHEMRSSDFWKRKLWEWNAGWMGLALSYVLALLFTQGIKNMFGKPRPDLLSRCMPDLSSIQDHVVGGYGQDVSARWTLVSSSICTQTNLSIMNDGFRSFLSGHSSSSWAGLLYLSLWLAVKFNITIPYLQPYTSNDMHPSESLDDEQGLPLHNTRNSHTDDRSEDLTLGRNSVRPRQSPDYRNRAAAPPIFGPVIVTIPICLAIYISSTRYVDFKHKGVDIFSGSLLGVASAWIGFRFYNASLTEGQAWTWGPRPQEHAFAVSTGNKGWLHTPSARNRVNRLVPESSTRLTDRNVEAGSSENGQNNK